MFFKTADFSPDVLSVFRFAWNEKVQDSDIRPYHALSFRVKGQAKFIHKNETVAVKTGDVVFVPAYYPYTLDCGKEQVIVAHFTTAGDMPEHILKFTPESSFSFENLFLRLYHAYTKKEIGFAHECRSLFHEIILRIERETKADLMESDNGGIVPALEMIHERFTDPQLTVTQLAKSCNMSETHFRNLFRRHSGASPLQYINGLKRQYAVELLRSRYYTVSEVAERCGFANPYYFSLFIKRLTGRSPSDFVKEAFDSCKRPEEEPARDGSAILQKSTGQAGAGGV